MIYVLDKFCKLDKDYVVNDSLKIYNPSEEKELKFIAFHLESVFSSHNERFGYFDEKLNEYRELIHNDDPCEIIESFLEKYERDCGVIEGSNCYIRLAKISIAIHLESKGLEFLFSTEVKMINIVNFLTKTIGHNAVSGLNMLFGYHDSFFFFNHKSRLKLINSVFKSKLSATLFPKSMNKVVGDFALNLKYLEKHMRLNDKKIDFLAQIISNIEFGRMKTTDIISYTSIIEMFLIRKPDTKRYHIEDSIAKQFVLKTVTVMYVYNDETDLDFYKLLLKNIYNNRSNLAHGNSFDLKLSNAFIEQYNRVFPKNTLDFSEQSIILIFLLSELSKISSIVFRMYLENYDFVEFLKSA